MTTPMTAVERSRRLRRRLQLKAAQTLNLRVRDRGQWIGPDEQHWPYRGPYGPYGRYGRECWNVQEPDHLAFGVRSVRGPGDLPIPEWSDGRTLRDEIAVLRFAFGCADCRIADDRGAATSGGTIDDRFPQRP